MRFGRLTERGDGERVFPMKLRPLPVLFSILMIAGSCLGSPLSVAKIFADHGVLQRDVPVPVWGWATAGKEVTVEFAGQSKKTVSDEDGRWFVELARLDEDATGRRLTVTSDDEKVEVKGLLVGEVWYASGQSNMQMTLGACAKKLEKIAGMVSEPESRLIRTLRIGNPDSADELEDLPEPVVWQLDLAKNRTEQSAAAYFFARQLHDDLKVPVGIIEGSWGGKPIEGFIPREQFAKRAELKPILELSKAGDLDAIKELEGGVIIRNTAGMPGRIYHARIAPVAPYALKGFIWYQGESNAGNGEDPRNYRFKMEGLVGGWRSAWKNEDLPFCFVQLPSFNDSATGWVRLREEQRRSLNIRQTGMAVTIDLLDPDIHPSNKLDVGGRLARWALAETYGRELAFSGPLFKSIKIEGRQIRVSFDHVGDGLMIAKKGGLEAPVEIEGGSPAHFEVADQSGVWRPAEARISGKEVWVSHPSIKNPVAVRYACEGEVEKANLYNRAGLPASPFCSKLEFLPWSH